MKTEIKILSDKVIWYSSNHEYKIEFKDKIYSVKLYDSSRSTEVEILDDDEWRDITYEHKTPEERELSNYIINNLKESTDE